MIEMRKFYYCDHCKKSIVEHVHFEDWHKFRKLGVIPMIILDRHIENYEPVFCSKECFLKFVSDKIDWFLNEASIS